MSTSDKLLEKYFPGIPDTSFETIARILFPRGQYTINSILGTGLYSIVYKIVETGTMLEYACKISPSKQEFEVQRLFEEFEMAPEIREIVELSQYRGVYVCIMDIVTGTLRQFMDTHDVKEEFIFDALVCLIKKKYLFKYPLPFFHGDLHIDNIVILKNGKTLGLIDFAFAQQAPPVYQIMDALALVGSLIKYRIKTQRYTNLSSMVLELYNKMFGLAGTDSEMKSSYFM